MRSFIKTTPLTLLIPLLIARNALGVDRLTA